MACGLTDLADIDWSQPWFSPWRELGEPTVRLAIRQQSVGEALNATRAGLSLGVVKEVTFVSQSALPEGQAFEDFIF